MKKTTTAFTIVELLIVIVVIAILAAISIVAYNGIQQRANNTAITSAASNSMKLIQAYIAQEGRYPRVVSSGGVNRCITSESGCWDGAGTGISQDTTLDTELAKVGTPPRSVPNKGDDNRNGIIYTYISTRMVNEISQPVSITYWLQGTDQDCGVSGVISRSNSSANGGKTQCTVSIPGPVH